MAAELDESPSVLSLFETSLELADCSAETSLSCGLLSRAAAGWPSRHFHYCRWRCSRMRVVASRG